MRVWLTDWQVGEDRILVRMGDVVDWTLFEADRDWLTRLFEDRVTVEWQLDTYGDATEQPTRRVHGKVVDLQSVRCREVTTREGRVPRTGEAQLCAIEDTSGSWERRTTATMHGKEHSTNGLDYSGSYSSAIQSDELDATYGYVVTLKLRDDLEKTRNNERNG